MPIVRIDILRHADVTFARRAGRIVYEAMKSAINVPDDDNFQTLSEHDTRHLIYDPSYLGIERTDGVIIIQIALNEGRSTDQKRVLYRTIAEGLQAQLGVRGADLLINLVEVKKENWSFGNGVAQYAG